MSDLIEVTVEVPDPVAIDVEVLDDIAIDIDVAEAGERGPAGKSAYQSWLDSGNAGTEADYVAWTKGQDGKSAYESWLGLGNVGTEADYVAWTKGQDGIDGDDGEDGQNGESPELRTDSGFVQWRLPSAAEWTNLIALSAISGADGDDGIDGDDGREIELGTSATHIRWRYVGAETWTDLVALADLKGEPGDDAAATGDAEIAAFIDNVASATRASLDALYAGGTGGSGLTEYPDVAAVNALEDEDFGKITLADVQTLIAAADAGIGSTVYIATYVANDGFGGSLPPASGSYLRQVAEFMQGGQNYPLRYTRYRFWTAGSPGVWGSWTELLNDEIPFPQSSSFDYTLSVFDVHTGTVRINSSSARSVIIPLNSAEPITVGTRLHITREGTGSVTIVPDSGVTLYSAYSDNTLRGRYSAASLVKLASNTWLVTGDMGPGDLAIAAGSANNPHMSASAARNPLLPVNWWVTSSAPINAIDGDRWIEIP